MGTYCDGITDHIVAVAIPSSATTERPFVAAQLFNETLINQFHLLVSVRAGSRWRIARAFDWVMF
jgi:hypothetical protein